MQIDLTKLDGCCLPAIHSIGMRGLNMFNVYYVDSYNLRLLVALEYACRVNAELRAKVFEELGSEGGYLEIDARALLDVEERLHEDVEKVLDEYMDDVCVGDLDGGPVRDDILTAIDRRTLILLGALAGGIRYALAGAYTVTLCKVNSSESYVIKLGELGETYDKSNPRKIAQRNSWRKDFTDIVNCNFLWLGKCVKFSNIVYIEMCREGDNW